jgi:hypothetical protein
MHKVLMDSNDGADLEEGDDDVEVALSDTSLWWWWSWCRLSVGSPDVDMTHPLSPGHADKHCPSASTHTPQRC